MRCVTVNRGIHGHTDIKVPPTSVAMGYGVEHEDILGSIPGRGNIQLGQ
jgi:hypothetical protein